MSPASGGKAAGRKGGGGKGGGGKGGGAKAPAVEASTARARGCPICGKPPVERYHPFCSKRCADVDLNRWLSGSYAIPGKAEEDEDGTPPQGEP